MSSEKEIASKKATNENTVDDVVRKSVEVVSQFPPPVKGWNRMVTWQVIKHKLAESDKNIIIWGMAMAASISLVVAASINVVNYFVPRVQNSETISFQKELPKEQKTVSNKRSAQRIESTKFDYLEKKKSPINNPDVFQNAATLDLGSSKVVKDNFVNYESDVIKVTKVAPHLSLNHSTAFGTPGVGLGIDLNLRTKVKGMYMEQWKIGVSSSVQSFNSESGSSVSPLTFLNMGFDRTNVHNEKGWSFSAGMLLNSDTNLFKNNTLRFSVSRQFNKRLKAGPEVIFTNNFTKAYPGVKLILS